uniref:CSON000146 protein n=1 Tax=Culicoides sonorensis TaxID=179676 RepID=A0A336LTB5_CULSO
MAVSIPEMSLENGNDDSIVILGASPPNSMNESFSVGTSISLIQLEAEPVSNGESEITTNKFRNTPNSAIERNGDIEGHSTFSSSQVTMDKTFATKFLLGQVDANVLQKSVIQQFPSLNGSHIAMDDVMKLSCLVEEHQQLKENLEKTNQIMRNQFSVLQEWQDAVKTRMLEKNALNNKLKEELAFTKTENERLNTDLKALKQKLEETVSTFNAFEISAKKEISDMNMKLSENNAIIQNISAENERLQLEKADFVFVQKNKPENSFKPEDFMKKSEHDLIVKELNRKTSDLLAQNLEFEDMKKVYKDELDCLKVNLTAAEELHKEMRNTISTLNTSNTENCKRVEDVSKKLKVVQDENDLLKAQVEIYHKDFLMEREAREKLATEKDNILSELQLLKMRNKQLIDDTQQRLKTVGQTNAFGESSSASNTNSHPPKSASPEAENQKNRYYCPICNLELKTLRLLEQHIDICLKD